MKIRFLARGFSRSCNLKNLTDKWYLCIGGKNTLFERDLTDLTIKLTRIASRTVRKAQEENRRKDIANVYEINGRNIWQLPDGLFTDKSPF